MGDLVDHAYDHALMVTCDAEAAFDIAVAACSRSSRSRAAALAHARHLALRQPGCTGGVVIADRADLPAVALALAHGRSSRERAIIDLATRHELDRGALARALGLPAARAAALATEVIERWERDLGPVVMAHLGPGDCAALGAILPEPPAEGGDESDSRSELSRAVAVGPAVAAHVEGCAPCSDRARSCASVRDLLGRVSLEQAPDEVRRRLARTRRGVSPPVPAIDARPRLARRLAAAALALVALTGGLAAVRLTRADRPRDLGALASVPATNHLAVERAVVRPGDEVIVRNSSTEPLSWRAEPDVAWLTVLPSTGRLAPGAEASLVPSLAGVVPEGAASGSLRITANEGSTTRVLVETIVERSPLVAAMAAGCAVTATVEDDGALATVVLESRSPGTAARSVPMEQGDRGWLALLPRSIRPVSWWVEASDARGNRGRSPDQVTLPGACSP